MSGIWSNLFVDANNMVHVNRGMDMDMVDFYNGSLLVTSVKSSIVPRVDEFINIAKVTYRVTRVTYAVDYSDLNMTGRNMRVSVDLEIFED